MLACVLFGGQLVCHCKMVLTVFQVVLVETVNTILPVDPQTVQSLERIGRVQKQNLLSTNFSTEETSELTYCVLF